jgi:glucose-6-phosphate 1-dehydrogenase
MIEPCTFIIFGATGNLASNKLIPALYHLEAAGRLPPEMVIVGISRSGWGDDDYREEVAQYLAPKARDGLDEAVLERFTQRLHYFKADLHDPHAYRGLVRYIGENRFPGNHIFYLAIRPAEFGEVVTHLASVGLNDESNGCSRVVIEKPFGYDLESAHILEQQLHTWARARCRTCWCSASPT